MLILAYVCNTVSIYDMLLMLYLYTDAMRIYLRKLRGRWHYIGHRKYMDYSAYRGSERPEGV